MELNGYGMNNNTFDDDNELCYLVKQHLQLFKKGHKSYDQKNAIDKAWRTIAHTLGKSVPECKARWEILCDHNAYLCAIKSNLEQNELSRICKETEVDEEEDDDEDDEVYLDNQSRTTNQMHCTKFNNCTFGFFG